MARIKDYIPTIKNKLLPMMYDKYGISFKSEPVLLRITAVTYTGSDLENKRVMLEFNSEYQEKGKAKMDSNQLFATVFYGFAGNKAGYVDISNVDEATDILYSALYELGFKTPEDLEDEKKRAQEEKERAEKEKEEEINKKREKEKARHEAMFNQDNEPKDTPEEETTEETDTYSSSIDSALSSFYGRHEINSTIHCTYLIPDSAKQNVFDVDVHYISQTKCYVKSEYLNLDSVYNAKDLQPFLIDLESKYTPRVVSVYSANDELIYNDIVS